MTGEYYLILVYGWVANMRDQCFSWEFTHSLPRRNILMYSLNTAELTEIIYKKALKVLYKHMIRSKVTFECLPKPDNNNSMPFAL